MKTFGWMVIVAVFLTTSSTSRAQGPPPRETCGQVVNTVGVAETSISACVNELLSAQLDMIDAVEGVVIEMQALNLSFFGPAQNGLRLSVMEDDLTGKIQFLRDEHGRAMEANEAVEEGDYDEAFAKADQEKGKKCKLSDMNFFESLEGDPPPGLRDPDTKFGDGKCNVFRATVDIPGAPNDGEIVHVNERRENMCEEVCADRINPNGQGMPRKKERKERVAGRLSDGIAAAVRATETISVAMANLSTLNLQLSQIDSSTSGTSEDVCVSGFDVPGLLEIIATGVSIANSVVGFTTAALETLKDNVEPAANQTVAGFNAGSSVIPFALVAGISKMAGEVIGGVEKGLTIAAQIVSANRSDTIEECLKSVRDDAVDLRGELIAELACVGGSNEGLACVADGDCPDGTCEGGAIPRLQEAVTRLQAGADQTNAELAAVRVELALMKSLLEGNRELLLTPFGKRDGGHP